ncbi:hypothetical protein MLD38_001607 [Melastoma candidum]|uniref:Uncharacterized protein n=1 Tax=Melastoma candidum TaxID=119954 RepID=A0ACB9SES5_9MYRT|nr:hypothetical protein MLD38_001607 [Melastoma candidum]
MFDVWEMWGLREFWVLGLVLGVSWLSCCCRTASADIVLIGKNTTQSFRSVDATFAPTVRPSGVRGTLYLAEPLDACAELTSKADHRVNGGSPFVLVVRGGCSFWDKVRRAQEAGFVAVVVYNDEDYGHLVAMSGSSAGIKVHAVFVSRSSGELLKEYIGPTDVKLLILPSSIYSAWSVMAILFIFLLAMSGILATYFIVRRLRIRWESPRAHHDRQFHGMSSHLVKAMPSLVFTSVLEENSTSQSCAICLEDYIVGEKLRILPCCHKFHVLCVDAWLTSWRTFCPVCKRDARTATGKPTASESTPLLSSTPVSVESSPVVSSHVRSSVASSPAIQINQAHLPRSALHTSAPANMHTQQSFHSCWQSPSVARVSRSSVDLRNTSSPMSRGSVHSASPLSVALTYPSLTPANLRFMSYMASQSNASPSYLRRSYQQNSLHGSRSAASLFPVASIRSLPEC